MEKKEERSLALKIRPGTPISSFFILFAPPTCLDRPLLPWLPECPMINRSAQCQKETKEIEREKEEASYGNNFFFFSPSFIVLHLLKLPSLLP